MDLHVDRLSLRLTDFSEAEARRLSALVAECLASADAPGAADTADRLRVTLAAHPGEGIESMARRIAAELLQALARSS